MRIFFPVEVFYPSQAGGPANSIYWITKNIRKYGFEPVIVATDKGIQGDVPLNKWLETDGGRVMYVKTRFLNYPFFQTLISLGTFLKADVIHISSFFFPTAFITAIAARLSRKKIVWSARGELDTPALEHSRMRKRPILWFIKKVVGKYPIFHSTCDAESAYINKIFGAGARIVQIPNYLEIPSRCKRDASNYLLYIGRIHPKKAIDNLLRALAISQVFLKSDFVLKIAGTGKAEFESELRDLVRDLHLTDKVSFVGHVEGASKQKLLADAYFTIMPSHTENFGLVVLESLAQETPVIASTGSPWQVLETEKVGIWTANSPESLARQIDKILEIENDVYEGYRRRSREFVMREFDIEKNIEKWIETYNNLDQVPFFGAPTIFR